jgi:hypothetical protein
VTAPPTRWESLEKALLYPYSAMDGKLKSIHGVWIPAIHAGMTIFENSEHVI